MANRFPRKAPRMNLNVLASLLLLGSFTTTGCGGSNDSSGTVVAGSLRQGETAAAERTLDVRVQHGVGETIEHVEICGAGRCGTTDDAGNFGFATGSDYHGGPLLLSVNGHGIDSTVVLDVPSDTDSIDVELVNEPTGVVVHSLVADGVDLSPEDAHDHLE